METNGKAKIPFRELFDRYAELRADTSMFSLSRFSADLIAQRNPLVKESYEKLGKDKVRELNYNQTQIKRELLKYGKSELAYKIVHKNRKNEITAYLRRFGDKTDGQSVRPCRVIRYKYMLPKYRRQEHRLRDSYKEQDCYEETDRRREQIR